MQQLKVNAKLEYCNTISSFTVTTLFRDENTANGIAPTYRCERKKTKQSQEKAIMSSSKLPIHWSIRESQLMTSSATHLQIVERVDSRAARDSHFCVRACREEHHSNKSDTKSNILTNVSFSSCCAVDVRGDAPNGLFSHQLQVDCRREALKVRLWSSCCGESVVVFKIAV
jgi:hypothetical protein